MSKLAAMLSQPGITPVVAPTPEKKTTKSSVFTGELVILEGRATLDIKCYNAAEADSIERNNLHAHTTKQKNEKGEDVEVTTYSKVKNGTQFCSGCNKTISKDEIVKGVEVGKDKYVTLTDQEIQEVAPLKANQMFVTAYVKPEDVNLTYIEDSEYVCIDPDSKNPRKEVFDTFVDAMFKHGRYGKGVRVKGNREQYFIIRPVMNKLADGSIAYGMMLHHLFAEYEVRECNKFQKAEPNSELSAVIGQYMEETTEGFVPAKYDSFLGNTRNLVLAKSNGAVASIKQSHMAQAPATDLIGALKDALKTKSAKAGK